MAIAGSAPAVTTAGDAAGIDHIAMWQQLAVGGTRPTGAQLGLGRSAGSVQGICVF